jgi:hypothetical protein
VHAVIVEGVPACSLDTLAIAGEIGLAHTFIDEIVLAGDVMHIECGLAD